MIGILDLFYHGSISNAMAQSFCIEVLEEALLHSAPEIFNSDQGDQFFSKEFVKALENSGIKVSMDGKGRVFDNILVERLWKLVKYENVYIKRYENGIDATNGINHYFQFYNNERYIIIRQDQFTREVLCHKRKKDNKSKQKRFCKIKYFFDLKRIQSSSNIKKYFR